MARQLQMNVPLEPRVCTTCSASSPEAIFTYHFNNSTECRDCQARSYLLPQASPRNSLERKLRQYRDVREQTYQRLYEEQGGVCAICHKGETAARTGFNPGGVKRLAIDHDHDTGEPRGLLCHSCNIGLGRMRDDPEILIAAALYLEKSYVSS